MVQYSRTYFLTANSPRHLKVIPLENFADQITDYDIKLEKDPLFADGYKLVMIYLKMLHSYYKFTANLVANTRPGVLAKVAKSIEKKILTLEEKLSKVTPTTEAGGEDSQTNQMTEKVVVEVWAIDILGDRYPLEYLTTKGQDFRNYMLVPTIKVLDIKSVLHPNKVMGSVVVSDTFVFAQKYDLILI